MSLKYKVMSTYQPGKGKDGDQIYFPKLTGTSQVNLKDVANILAQQTSAHQADVSLVITGLVSLIPDLLEQGKTIKLDGLGTFRLHARVKTETDPEMITNHNIKELRLSFTPDKEMKRAIKGIKVYKE